MTDKAEETITAYVAAWNQLELGVLADFWLDDPSGIYYLAEESEHPYFSLDEVKAYWQLSQKLVSEIDMSIDELRIKSLSDQHCVASYSMHMDARVGANAPLDGHLIGVDVQVSTIMQFHSNEWRLIHYAESPLGPLPFMRKAYRNQVRNL